MKLHNYVLGAWIAGEGDGQQLHNAITGAVIAQATSKGINFEEVLNYGRTIGGHKLRKMTFQERGRMLKALALYLQERKETYYALSYATGATRADSWIDIEGGIGNLFSYASLRRQFPDLPYHLDGDNIKSSKNGSFIGQHICVPKQGVAIHINAFNFPVWGMLEKIAVNLLAGMPAVVKPATLTCFLTELVTKDIIASGILPEGSLQLICGSANGILDTVCNQDVVTFTGSAHTGKMLKSHPQILAESVPFNLEADSLNAMVLGLDAVPGTLEFDLFIKEATKEITIKAGQKCTAVRRLIVPENCMEDVQIALSKRLGGVVMGNPQTEGVRMGSLAGFSQVEEVKDKVTELSKTQKIVFGSIDNFDLVNGAKTSGAYFSPLLFLNDNPFKNTDCHNIEAFGPVSTLMPYSTTNEAAELVKLGKGSLVSSITTANNTIAREFVVEAACMNGRILILNNDCAKESTGHGSPLPLLVHGGPGRAGGGEEMGGMRGVMHYMQRTALQGSPTTITHITQQYQYGASTIETDVHPFKRYFEDLQIAETLITAKHTVTETDLTNFANVSGDNFYAHMDATSLEGTMFTGRVAHGYFVLSKAAGLFVDAKKGPVLLNYGLENCRFVKPVYPGATIGVRFTCKEKIDQEKKSDDDIAKGIVKWLVDIYDETDETVAIATILTMVKKRNQD
jgi:oxepin-CoA hydrolase / 3-oxo-5,6-dehydrosuberyl-CoA semialdehyde dehydrogenase